MIYLAIWIKDESILFHESNLISVYSNTKQVHVTKSDKNEKILDR